MKHKNKKYFSLIIITVILSIFFSILVINYFSKKADYILMPIAKEKTRKYITKIINESTKNITFSNNLYHIKRDNDGNIEFIGYDTLEVTKIISEVTNNIQKNLDKLSSDNIISYVNMGVIFDSSFLRNIGPKMGIKFDFLGDIISNIETEVKPYGVNNAYIEVRISLEVNGMMVLPFTSEEIKINNKIPILMNVVSGKVPSGYITSYSN